MLVDVFESTIIAGAGYRLARKYKTDGSTEVRIYQRESGPLVRIEVVDGEVDDIHALTIEVLLDEEGFFEKD